MLLKLLSAAVIGGFGVVGVAVESGLANECNSNGSFIQMPDGKCYGLDYMTVVARSRAGLKDATSLYNQALRLNAAAGTSTSIVQNLSRNVSRVTTTTPSSSVREETKQLVEDTAKNLNNTAAQNEEIERWAFRQNMRVINQIQGQLSGR